MVLAAGEGRRFAGGVHKLAVSLRGRPLVSWAVGAALDAGLDETIVVIGAHDVTQHLPDTVTVIVNESWAEGQASSLRAALDWCARQGHSGAVIGLGDQPLVPAGAWRSVAFARDGPIASATFQGRRRPPVRLDSSVWSLVPVAGDEGARAVMRRRPELVFEVACDGDPIDIDTLDDLKAVETRTLEVRKTWS